MTLTEALNTGWPFRRRAQIVWFEAMEGGTIVMLAGRHRNRSLRNLEVGHAASFSSHDITADDWEIFIWCSGPAMCDGIWSDLAALKAREG